MLNHVKDTLSDWLSRTPTGRQLVDELETEARADQERTRQEARAKLDELERQSAAALPILQERAAQAEQTCEEQRQAYKQAKAEAVEAQAEYQNWSIRFERAQRYWRTQLRRLAQPAVDALADELDAAIEATKVQSFDTETEWGRDGRPHVTKVHWGPEHRDARLRALYAARRDVTTIREAGFEDAELNQRVAELWEGIPPLPEEAAS